MAADNSTVIYQDIDGFPGYRVGDDGSVWSGWRGPLITDQWKKLKPGIHQRRTPSRTYLYLHLWRNGKRHTRLVHRIVLEAFVGPRPPGAECRHLDGNPMNNSRSNLCWGTHAENTADTRRHGRIEAKLTESQVVDIRRRRAAGETPKAIAESLGVPRTTVGSIVNGYSWKHLLPS